MFVFCVVVVFGIMGVVRVMVVFLIVVVSSHFDYGTVDDAVSAKGEFFLLVVRVVVVMRVAVSVAVGTFAMVVRINFGSVAGFVGSGSDSCRIAAATCKASQSDDDQNECCIFHGV
jgi:hypothetical protein